MEIIPVLHNIRSTYNVGAILRTAEGFGVKQVLLSGITPKIISPIKHNPVSSSSSSPLPHVLRKTSAQIAKTALGAEKNLSILNLADFSALQAQISIFRTTGFQVLALENNLSSTTVFPLADSRLKSLLGSKILLLLGEEVSGLCPDLLALADYCAEIPMFGQKESFNVSVAAGMALYEFLGRKLL